MATASIAAGTDLSVSGVASATTEPRLGRREHYVVTDFIKNDGVTNGDLGLARLHELIAKRELDGNTPAITWPAGRYVYQTMPNWAINCLQIDFVGEVWLINTGTGNSLIFDGGETGTGIYGLKVTGFPRIYGGPNSRNGVFARALYRSQLEISCRGAGQTFAGFHGEWLVSNEIRFSINRNEGGLYSAPRYGMLLTSRGTDLRYMSSYNSIYEPEFSGLAVGLRLDDALGNKVFGGAVQGNELGAETTDRAWANKFFGTDFEANQRDFVDRGRTTQFYGCDFERGPIIAKGSRDAQLIGGETERIEIEDGATRPLLNGVVYNRLGRGNVKDSGQTTRSRDVRDARAGWPDGRPTRRLEPALDGQTIDYNNASNLNEVVVVSGGQDVTVFIGQDKLLSLPGSGQFILRPRDRLRVKFGQTSPTVEVSTL